MYLSNHETTWRKIPQGYHLHTASLITWNLGTTFSVSQPGISNDLIYLIFYSCIIIILEMAVIWSADNLIICTVERETVCGHPNSIHWHPFILFIVKHNMAQLTVATHHIEMRVCTSTHSRLSTGHLRSSCSSRERPLSGDELMTHKNAVTNSAPGTQASRPHTGS